MEKNNVNVSIGDSKIITINDREIMVKKLGLLTYTVMSRNIKELISVSLEMIRGLVNDGNISILDLDENVPANERAKVYAESVSKILENNIMQVIKLIDICVPDLGYEYICNNVGISDAIYILKTVVEVNHLQKVGDEIKNMLRGLRKA